MRIEAARTIGGAKYGEYEDRRRGYCEKLNSANITPAKTLMPTIAGGTSAWIVRIEGTPYGHRV